MINTKGALVFLIMTSLRVYSAELLESNVSRPIDAVAPIKLYDMSAPEGIHHRRIALRSATNQPPANSTNDSIVVLEMGMNYLDEQGVLRPADPLIEAAPGGAIARQTGIKVKFSDDINIEGAIDILTADKVRLRGTPLGLSYYDPVSGQSVMIAETRSSIGKITGRNRVVYENFLDDIAADAVYEVTKAGVMQLVVIKENIAPPSAYGLPDESSRLEVITEFIAAPNPRKRTRTLKQELDPARRAQMIEPDFTDSTLYFEQSVMTPGIAFGLNLDKNDPVKKQPVGKYWQEMPGEGRSILFEAVEYNGLKDQLKTLPVQQASSERSASIGRVFPSRRIAGREGRPLQIAGTEYRPKGYGVDFSVITSTGALYFIPGRTYLVYGNFRAERADFNNGSVLKFEKQSSLSIQNMVVCYQSASQPAVLTAYDDDSVGDPIGAHVHNGGNRPASTGEPTGSYATTALTVESTLTSPLIKNLRFRFATTGIRYEATATGTIQDCWFDRIGTGVQIVGGAPSLSGLRTCNVSVPYTGTPSGSPTIIPDCSGGYAEGYMEVPKSQMTAFASSYTPPFVASQAIDNNITGIGWHSAQNTEFSTTEYIGVDFGTTAEGQPISRWIGMVKYRPRDDNVHGTFKGYKIFVTDSLGSWGAPVAQGQWQWTISATNPDRILGQEKTVEFARTRGRYVILQCTEAYIGWASACEIGVYQIDPFSPVVDPIISPISGTYQSPLTISLACATSGAEIRYTTDGTDPNHTSSSIYSSPFQLTTAGNQTIKAKAFVTGMNPSAVVTRNYSIAASPSCEGIEIPKSQMIADSSTTNMAWLPQYAINGSLSDPGWHKDDNDWTYDNNWLRLDVGNNCYLSCMTYHSRQNADVGTFLDWEIYVTQSPSRNRIDWGPPVQTGTWSWGGGAGSRTISFTPKFGRYVILRCTRGVGINGGSWGDFYASAGEVWLYQAAITDADSDGLPDWWETQYFGNLSQNGTGDPDGDGFTSLQEYQSGSSPIDPALRVFIAEPKPNANIP